MIDYNDYAGEEYGKIISLVNCCSTGFLNDIQEDVAILFFIP